MRIQAKLIPLALVTIVTACLHAQQETIPPQRNPYPEHTWPSYESSGEHLDVITLAEPTVRHPCRVKHFHADDIICHGIHGQQPITYKRQDVAALINPPSHRQLWQTVAATSIAAGVIAASVFVPVTGVAVLMQVAGGITIFGSIMDCFDLQENHDDDILVYQRAGTKLAVALTPGK